eukprot:NODE_8_length_4602_cov_14.880894.p1 GENE.NODE_8_length_4602_cov_14.880894~~NODE_8_length_4602_cov_14.880894.p1  ORF type:complete len:1434 (-),score=594.45 NODE_8_length_4602_cov_14.880894:300-3986(-)
MQQEIVRLRGVTKDAEERVRVKQLLVEIAVRLQAAELDVDKVASAAVPLAEDQPSAEAVERMQRATNSANNKLTTTIKLVEVKLKSAQGFLKEELQGMRGRLAQAEKKLNDVSLAAKMHKERLEAADLVALTAEQVEKAEAEMMRTEEAELPFLKGIEVLSAKEAQTALGDCEAAATAAQKAITAARTFAIQKLGEAKGFTDTIADACTKELMALQKRLDAGATRLTEVKKDTAERRRKTQMQASAEKVSEVEAAVKKLSEEMEAFADDKLGQITQDDARRACEEIANAEQEAQQAVTDAKKFLAARMQEMKAFSEAQRAPMAADLTKLQQKLTQHQVDLAKLSKQCTEREQRFVAQRLLQEATATHETLKADIDNATKVSALILGDDKTEFLKLLCVQAAVDGMRAYLKKTGGDADALHAEIAKGGKEIDSKAFAEFVTKLPELTGKDDASFSEKQLTTVFNAVAGGAKKLPLAQFKSLFHERRVCKSRTSLSDAAHDGKALGFLEIGEGVEVLDQKGAEDGSDCLVKVMVERDGTVAWMSAKTSEGTAALATRPLGAGRAESVEAYVSAVHAHCVAAAEYADRKTAEVASVKQGPLAEVKAKLLQLRTKVSQEQTRVDHLKKRVVSTKAELLQERKVEVQKVQEVRCKAFAERSVKEATAVVTAAEETATKAAAGLKKGGNVEELRLAELITMKTTADKTFQTLAEAKAAITKETDAHEVYKGASRNLLLEARVELTKLAARVTAAEAKVRTATEAAQAVYVEKVGQAKKNARDALRTSAQASRKDSDALFEQITGKKAEMTMVQFQEFMGTLRDHNLDAAQLKLVFQEFAPNGMRKPTFAKALQQFCTCARSIAITADFDMLGGSVRKLEVGELFEVLEGPREDAEKQLERVRGRALRDDATGWVTVQGNQGTPFLKHTMKPYLWCTREHALHEKADEKSATIRQLQRDELLELLEGPREQAAEPALLLRGCASKDGVIGWITLRDKTGVNATTSDKLYVCRSTTALTDVFDIKACQVVRKVDIGETLEILPGQKEKVDEKTGITRLQFKAVRDGKEGWVTLKGNQGTVFVEPSQSHYVLSKAAELREASTADAPVVRELKKGEAFEALDTPVEEKAEGQLIVRARAQEDAKGGWILFRGAPAPLRPWKPLYTCKAPVALTPTLAAKGADAVRRAEPGEVFEIVDGPTLDKTSSSRRVRCATASEGVIGWATIRDTHGMALLQVA